MNIFQSWLMEVSFIIRKALPHKYFYPLFYLLLYFLFIVPFSNYFYKVSFHWSTLLCIQSDNNLEPRNLTGSTLITTHLHQLPCQNREAQEALVLIRTSHTDTNTAWMWLDNRNQSSIWGIPHKGRSPEPKVALEGS